LTEIYPTLKVPSLEETFILVPHKYAAGFCPQETCAHFCEGFSITKRLRLLLTHILGLLRFFRPSKVYPWANPTQIAN